MKILNVYTPEIVEKEWDSQDYELANLEADMKLFDDNYFGAEETHRLYIMPDAARDLLKFISWGRATIENRVEQGGILVGNKYHDVDKSVVFSVAERAIPAYKAKGSSGFLEVGPEVWLQMHRDLEEINRSEKKAYEILGMFHTHPNSLDVFMSGEDKNTQRIHFSQEESMALVLNPHRRIWKCFRGKYAVPCKAEMLLTCEQLGSMSKEKIYHKYIGRIL